MEIEIRGMPISYVRGPEIIHPIVYFNILQKTLTNGYSLQFKIDVQKSYLPVLNKIFFKLHPLIKKLGFDINDIEKYNGKLLFFEADRLYFKNKEDLQQFQEEIFFPRYIAYKLSLENY